MVSRKLRETLLRLKLECSGFYEDVVFDELIEKKAKNSITQWMLRLQELKGIRIRKFKDLFGKLDEIEFPIKIILSYGFITLDIQFVDNVGKKYYMLNRGSVSYQDCDIYIIGRRDSSLEPLLDRDFHYKIGKDGTICLVESGVLRLNEDGTNDNIKVDFYYDIVKNITIAVLMSYENKNKIIIQYPKKCDEFDKMVMRYLFNISDKMSYYYDVFPILRMMLEELAIAKITIFIEAEFNGKVSSNVDVVGGIVKRYTKTEVIGNEEITTCTKTFSKDLEEFLLEMKLLQ